MFNPYQRYFELLEMNCFKVSILCIRLVSPQTYNLTLIVLAFSSNGYNRDILILTQAIM